ncbi:MAG: hypothetical protein ABSF83_14685, partial [Nitrososphaerales archaeon]
MKFVPYWIPMFDLGKTALLNRKRVALDGMSRFLKDSGLRPSDCLFVPYYEYRSGFELGEEIYHYITGLVFKEMGYLVLNEYVISEYDPEKAPRPDVCAFKTKEIEEMLSELRSRGVIRAGAFLEELQLFNFFGKQLYKARPVDVFEPLTSAEAVVVEVERTEFQRRGASQVQGYVLGNQGLFDEGYVSGPFMQPSPGTITLSEDGALAFRRPEPAYQPASLPERLEVRRRKELGNLRDLLVIQLFKNLPIRDIVSLCETDEASLSSYQDLLAAMVTIDPRVLMDAVREKR